jgi:hypothetical protein
MTPHKRDAIGVIEREWHELDERLDRAPDAAYDRAVFAGEGEGWRLRDLLAHVVFWQDLAARAAVRMTAENRKPAPDERLRDFVGEQRSADDINRDVVAAAQGRTVGEVRADLLAAHSRLIEALRACPDDLLFAGDGPEDLVRALYVPALLHLRIHREHIDAALNEGAIAR